MECIYQKLDFLDVSFVQMFDLADLIVIWRPDRKRGDSVTVQNVARSVSRLPPPTECSSARAAIYWIN